MPYSTPATPTSPAAALPTLLTGRPGHRRSYSHISLPDSAVVTPPTSSSSSAASSPEIPSTTQSSMTNYGSGAYAPLISLPRRRSASGHNGLTNLNDIMNSPAMTALQAHEPPSPTKKPRFQLGRDEDDDDDSSSDEANSSNKNGSTGAGLASADHAKNVASYPSSSAHASSTHPHAKQSDTDDDGRALPPLRLKQRPTHVHGHHVPFPRTASPRNSPRNSPRSSPRHSPTGSPATSHAALPAHQAPGPSALSHNVYVRPSLAHHGRSVSSTNDNNGAAAATSPKIAAPPMVRTVSSPVLLLSNGKPLKSSLKGSSSSSSIPFPSQSMVPSRMGVWLAPPGDNVNGHLRTASAPTSPMMGPTSEGDQTQVPFPSPNNVQMPMSPLVLLSDNAENQNNNSPMPSFGSTLSSLPSLDTSASTSSISSMASSDSASANGGSGAPEYLLSPLNMPGFADTPTNAHVRSASYDVLHGYHPTGYPGHQHTQSESFPSAHASQPTTPVAKTVHFPTPDSGGLATVKLYNKGGRPASLLRLGEETETETEGEGSAREGPARWGGWMSGFGGFGAAGKAWGRGGSSGGGGSSHSVGVHGRQGAQHHGGYPFPKVSSASASPLAPQLTRSDSGMAPMEHMQEVVTVETVVEVDGANSSPVPARGAQRGEGNVYLESIGFAKGTTPTPPADRLTMTGTLLVRNVAYLKTVAVRFTLDDWHTTTDVLARYERSLPSLPIRFARAAAGELIRSHSLADQNRGRVCHPDDVDQEAGDFGVVDGTATDEEQPAWDRFRFEIALGALGQSLSTLEGRVMWLVGRFSAGVDIADAVVSTEGNARPSAAPSVSRSASVERLDEILAERKPTQEWWDNNAGCNYRIGFVKKDVVSRKQVDTAAQDKKAAEEKRAAEELAKKKEAEAMMKEVERANGEYRRGLHVSAPSVYRATSPPAKSYPAPPQISSSNSFPGPSSPPAPSYGRYQQHQQKQHQEAVVQSTMARLKKLNLRNYAAPTKYTPPPAQEKKLPEDTILSPSNSTSADSTPLHTPTHIEDDERELAFGAENKNGSGASGSYVDVQTSHADEDADRTPTFQGALAPPTWGAGEHVGSELGMSANMAPRGFMGSMTMMMENGFPASMPANNSLLSPPGLDPGMMGSSPPFSAMSSADVGASLSNSRAAKSVVAANASSPLYWPWGSSESDKAAASNPAATGKENEPVGQSGSTPPLSAPVASLLSDIQEKSTSGAVVGNHIAPPQRRRAHHHHQQHSQQLSSDGSSSSLSSLTNGTGGSGNEIHSYPGTRPRHARTTSSPRTSPQIPSAPFSLGAGISAPVPVRKSSPTMWGLRTNSPRPGSPRAANGGYSSFGSSLSAAAPREGGTRSPLRLSPVNSGAAVDGPGSGSSRANANGARTPSPLASSTDSLSASASAPSDSHAEGGAAPANDFAMPTSPGAGQDDAVYQAFVRQWCFAQAPGPTVGASVGAAGAQTPVATTPRGEVGPRLVVS